MYPYTNFQVKKPFEYDGLQMSHVKELADYENCTDAPKLSVEDLVRDGFGEHPFYHCFVADVTTNEVQTEKQSKVIGYALYYFTYSTWHGKAIYMEDLFVKEHYRHKGIGTALWKAVSKEGLKNGCCKLNFTVLSWNSPSIKFYENCGAVNITASENWNLFQLRKTEMEKLVWK